MSISVVDCYGRSNQKETIHLHNQKKILKKIKRLFLYLVIFSKTVFRKINKKILKTKNKKISNSNKIKNRNKNKTKN